MISKQRCMQQLWNNTVLQILSTSLLVCKCMYKCTKGKKILIWNIMWLKGYDLETNKAYYQIK